MKSATSTFQKSSASITWNLKSLLQYELNLPQKEKRQCAFQLCRIKKSLSTSLSRNICCKWRSKLAQKCSKNADITKAMQSLIVTKVKLANIWVDCCIQWLKKRTVSSLYKQQFQSTRLKFLLKVLHGCSLAIKQKSKKVVLVDTSLWTTTLL